MNLFRLILWIFLVNFMQRLYSQDLKMEKINSNDHSKNFYLKALIGIQGAQIDGDYYAGYNKAGIISGLTVCRDVSEKNTASFSLFFSQKGARKNAVPEKNIFDYYRASLNYIEIPVSIFHRYKHFTFNAGCYYGRLISARESNQNGDIKTGVPFKSNDVGYILGAERKINENFSAGMRFSYSLIPIRDYFFNGQIYYYNIIQRFFNRGLYNNTLSFYIDYAIKPNKKNSNE